MKKIAIILLLVFAISLVASPLALLSSSQPHVDDEYGLLTDDEWSELDSWAEEISESYGCDVRIVVVPDMRDYGIYDIDEFSFYVYDEWGLGYGSNKDCMLFVMSMEDRDYFIRSWGYANIAITTYAKDEMIDNYILPALHNDNYYQAFYSFLDKVEEYLQIASEGDPYGSEYSSSSDGEEGLSSGVKVLIVIIVPCLIAFIICSIWRSKMKTAKIARTADNYVPDGGFNLTGQADIFLYRTTSSRRIERNTSSSSSRGGTSGRSGKF